MAEIAANPSQRFSVPIHWPRAIGAGVMATIIMTIIGAFLGMNFPKMIGSMIVPGASITVQYVVGGAMHLMIGIIYGIIYAALVGRLVEWNRFIKGTVYGLAIAAIAFAAMPLMSAMMGGGKSASTAQNPCHPQTGQQQAMNPCHPKEQPMVSGAKESAMNPCHPQSSQAMNPCHPKEKPMASGAKAPMNPCHPETSQPMNPCHPASGASAPYQQAAGGSNPCHMKSGAGNPCNPCGGGGGSTSGLLSVVNHLIYALTLAFVYGKVR